MRATGGAGSGLLSIMSQHPVIDIDNLSVRFGGKTVLEGVSLAVTPGEKLTLTCRSGCGKSTLLRCLLGFVPWKADRLAIEGTSLSTTTVWRLRRKMAYVPQEPQLSRGQTREVIAAAFQYRANELKRTNLSRLEELFEKFLLDPALLSEPVGSLSGGEKQRVVLIAALLLERSILLLDEASSALDPDSKKAVAAEIAARSDLTVLSIAHDTRGFNFGGRIADFDDLRSAEVAR